MRRFLSVVLLLSWTLAVRSDDAFTKVADIPYLDAAAKDDASKQCLLDLYLPKDKKDFATIVWFHGGGLKGGNRNSGAAFARRFTAEGFGVALVGYRLSPKVKCPVYLEDAAASVAWTHGNIGKHKGDPNKIFLSGHSAGGYLAAMLGLDNRWLDKHKIPINKIAGVMPVAGQMITHSTIREERGIRAAAPLIDDFAPCHHVRADAPPFLCFAADKDLPTRAEENIYFTAAMKAAGHKNIECRIVPGRNHGSIAGKFAEANDEVSLAMLEFMRKRTK
jgi:acetyl esterase/lipase